MKLRKISLLFFIAFISQINVLHAAAGEEKESDQPDKLGTKTKHDTDDSSSQSQKKVKIGINNAMTIFKTSYYTPLRRGFAILGLDYDAFLETQQYRIIADEDSEVDFDSPHSNFMQDIVIAAENIIIDGINKQLLLGCERAIISETKLDNRTRRFFNYAMYYKLSIGSAILSYFRNIPDLLKNAIMRHNIDVLFLLIQAGVNMNDVDADGKTPLMYAAGFGREDIINLLLTTGIDVNTTVNGSPGRTAFTFAAISKQKNILRILIDAGVDVDAQADSLVTVIDLNNFIAVECLIKAGVNVNVGRYDITPLRLAVENNDIRIVQLLIDSGADLDAGMSTALWDAAAEGYVEIVKALIVAGANININCYGNTPLIVAVSHGHTEVVKMLIDAGANLDFQTYPEGLPDQDDVQLETALMIAIESDDSVSVQMLIAAGANADLLNSQGQTAFDIASQEMKQVIQESLVKRQAVTQKVASLDSLDFNL